MKKGLKKIMSLMLAMMLVLGMTMTTFAAEIEDSKADLTDHTYKAYQIFKGTQATGEDKLGSVDWGTGVKSADLLLALKGDDIFKDDTGTNVFASATSAADVAAAMDGWEDYDKLAAAFAKHANDCITGTGVPVKDGATLDAGYYLIVDETDFPEGEPDGTAYNLSLLQLTNKGKIEIKNKTDVPAVEKKVQEINDTTGVDPVWQDGADYDIGDDIKFRLTGTLPSNYDDYGNYNFVFHDTLSEGLTYKEILSVRVNDERDITPTNTLPSTNEDGTTELTISFGDLKTIDKELKAGDKIIVEYTATLNNSAAKGSDGNTNEVYLEYSNNPNKGGEGKTPKDKVIVFTFDIEVNKVDDKGAELKGAGFTLYKLVDGKTENEGWVQIGEEISSEDITTFTFEGVDAGKYKLVETTVPQGYNKAEDIEFEVRAVYNTDSANPQLTSLAVYNVDGEDVLKDDKGNAVFSIETDKSKVSTNVVNQGGVELPETGGIGTTMFYILGGVLVLGCSVILITRKRMSRR